jgi:putative transposase
MDIDKAQVAIEAFEIDYGANCPKAVAKIVDHADVLLEFYRYPAERWIHLRTTNPIECTFATVRLPTKITKAPGLTPPVWRWPAVAAGACHP